MSTSLRGARNQLETVTRVTLAVLALASGVYTYLGVRGLLNGAPSTVFLGAVIYSAAVSIGIYAFWSYLFRFLPNVRSIRARASIYVSMAIGAAMIVAMSSWLNAAALAGSAALEQHMSLATEAYQERLDAAHSNALAAQSLLPDIQLAAARFGALSEQEQRSGALTGTSGAGTVVQLLRQLGAELERLAVEVEDNRAEVARRYEQGGRRLAQMRELVAGSGPIEDRARLFREESLGLIGEIAALQQLSVAASVRRVAEDLEASFIAPVADGGDAELRERQSEVVARVERAIQNQSQALARAADEILDRDAVAAPQYEPLSAPEAVLRYGMDFLPSWAGAISIDLLPAVLIFILIAVEGAIRRQEGDDLDLESMSAADVLRGAEIARRIQDAERGGAPVAPARDAAAGPEDGAPLRAEMERLAALTPRGGGGREVG